MSTQTPANGTEDSGPMLEALASAGAVEPSTPTHPAATAPVANDGDGEGTTESAKPAAPEDTTNAGYPDYAPQQQPGQMMMYPPDVVIQCVLDQIFASLACGIDLVGVSSHANAEGWIPVPALAALPAIADPSQVPGALMTALQRSTVIELDSTLSMTRPVMPVMQQAPIHYVPQPAMSSPQMMRHGGVPIQHGAVPAAMPVYDGMAVPGAVPGMYWQGGIPYFVSGSAMAPAAYATGMYDDVPRGVIDPGRPASAPMPSGGHVGSSDRARSSPYRSGSFGKGNRGSRRSRHGSHSSGCSHDDEDDPLSNTITTKQWLRIIRLHKYIPTLEKVTRDELLVMTDEELAQYPITEGARRKLRIEVAKWADAHGLPVPFTIPPSASPSRESSRSSSRSSSRANSLPGSRCGSFGSGERPKIIRGSSGRVDVMLEQTAKKLEGMRLAEDEADGESPSQPSQRAADTVTST